MKIIGIFGENVKIIGIFGMDLRDLRDGGQQDFPKRRFLVQLNNCGCSDLRVHAINSSSCPKSKSLSTMAHQIQIAGMDMDELDDQAFIAEFAELTKLCEIYERSTPAGEAKAFKPAKPSQVKLSPTSAPPVRYVRRNKEQFSQGDQDFLLF